MRDTIFVSYSHEDRNVLSELQSALSSLPEHVRFTTWDDTRISPSSLWRGEIDEALSTAAAAVLLLSPSFFASRFIVDHELPVLLAAAERGELKVFPVVLAACAHERVTGTVQAVNDPGRPLQTLDPPARSAVWDRLVAGLGGVAAEISDESHIQAETKRLENDVALVPAVAHVNDKMARAKADPVDQNELMRENTLVFLQGQWCQAVSTWLIEQAGRSDLPPYRSKAIVRMMKDVSATNEKALQRATEITQKFADDTLAMLKKAKESPTT
jgi:hypothetical protein